MPLPANTTLSLLPGGVARKPKLAMVVRMTEETLNALELLDASEQIEFEFGERSGIHIRTAFFQTAIHTLPQPSPELFVRTTTATNALRTTRPTPLKLSATVAARAICERGALPPEKLLKQINDTTAAAKKEKDDRKTIMLDTPPAAAAVKVKGKKKTTAMIPKKAGNPVMITPTPVRIVTQQKKMDGSSTATPSSASGPPLSKAELDSIRTRILHFLALGPQTSAVVIKELGGAENASAFHTTLEEVAVQEVSARKTQAHERIWRLKPRAWMEIRPYSYPTYSDNDRVVAGRMARQILSGLKVPETDPAWEHIRYRSNAGNIAARDPKEKERKPKQTDVRMKSEVTSIASSHQHQQRRDSPAATSVRVTSAPAAKPRPSAIADATLTSSSSSKRKAPQTADGEREEGELSASSTPPRMVASTNTSSVGRKLPGSRSTSTLANAPPAASSSRQHLQPPAGLPARPMTPPVASASARPNAPNGAKRQTGPVDARGPRRQHPQPPDEIERARPLPPVPPPAKASQGKAPPAAQAVRERPRERERERDRERESDRESYRGSERNRTDDRDRDRDRGRGVERHREAEMRLKEKQRMREKEMLDRERARGRDSGRERELERSAGVDTHTLPSSSSQQVPSAQSKTAGTKAKASKGATSLGSSGSSKKRKASDISDASGDESSDFDLDRIKMEHKMRKKAKPKAAAVASGPAVSRSEMASSMSTTSTLKSSGTVKLDGERERTRDRDSYPLKKASVTSNGAQRRERRDETPPTTPQHKLVKREERSPLPLVKKSMTGSPTSKAKAGGETRARSTSSRPKRQSPIYTSSEEEGEEDEKPLKTSVNKLGLKNKQSAVPVPPPPQSAPAGSSSRRADVNPPLSPSDHVVLRSRYANIYDPYLATFQKLVAQKNKINRMLRNNSGGSGTVSESDGADMDVEMMSPEELEALSQEHKKLHGELEAIKKLYAQ